MHDAPIAVRPGVKPVSVRVLFPEAGVIRVESERMFAALDGALCRRFLQAALRLRAVEDATFAPTPTPSVDLRYDQSRHRRKKVLSELALVLGRGAGEGKGMTVAPSAAARDRHGVVRYRHYAGRITGWRAERERVGAIRLHNPLLHRKRALCDAIERELMSTLGVTRYDTDAVKCRVDIDYDPERISAAQLVEILDTALVTTEHPAQLDKIDRELTICTASLPLAAVAQFAVPALMPVSAALFAYTALPSFTGAWSVVTKERRLGVDVLEFHRCACMPGYRTDSRWRRPVLVSLFRPLSGTPYRGPLEEDAARRVRQAAALCLAARGRAGNPGSAPHAQQGRHRGREHRRGRAGRRYHRRRIGDDRPACADGRIDARGERYRRSGVRVHRDGGRQNPHLGREVGRGDRNRENRSDTERHRRLQARFPTERRTTGRHGGRADAGGRGIGVRHDGPAGRRRRAQQRYGHGHPDGGAARDALDVGAVLAARRAGEGRPRARSALRNRHRAVRQDRHADARTPGARWDHCRQRPRGGRHIAVRCGRRKQVPSPDRARHLAEGARGTAGCSADRRGAIQGRARHHRHRRGSQNPRRQSPLHGARGRGADAGGHGRR